MGATCIVQADCPRLDHKAVVLPGLPGLDNPIASACA
jgi:hypothetical protein